MVKKKAVKTKAVSLKIDKLSDLQKNTPPSVAAIKTVTTLVQQQTVLEDRIAKGEELLASLRTQWTRLSQIDIPLAMKSAGTKALTLTDGTAVEVKDLVVGNIKDENEKAAFKWLRANQFGSLIKNSVVCVFGMGEDKIAKSVAAALKKMKVPFDLRETIHSSTLRAFVRERLAAGKPLPTSIDVATVPTTVIKRPKKI